MQTAGHDNEKCVGGVGECFCIRGIVCVCVGVYDVI